MASFWKSKVVPKFQKLFEKSKAKKQAAEFSKSFHSSKESLDKEIEERSADLSIQVVDIYRSSSTYISKKLLKEPEESAVKDHPEAVQALLQELSNGGFPGSQGVWETAAKVGPGLISGPVLYLFKKASAFVAEEALPDPPAEEAKAEEAEEKKDGEDAIASEANEAAAEAGVPAEDREVVVAEVSAIAVTARAGAEEKEEEEEKKKEGAERSVEEEAPKEGGGSIATGEGKAAPKPKAGGEGEAEKKESRAIEGGGAPSPAPAAHSAA